MPPLDFLRPLYERPHDRESLLNEVGAALGGHRLVAKLLPFYCDVPVTDLARWSLLLKHHATLVASTGDAHLFSCRTAEGESGGATREARFFLYGHPDYRGVHVLLTLEPPPFFRWLQAIVDRSFPTALTTFITHRTLGRLLESFRDTYGLSDLVIKRASYRIRYGEGNHEDRKRVVPGISWPDWELQEALNWVRQQNGWFQSLRFQARRDRQVLATISFGRQGLTQTDGMFRSVLAAFTEPVCKRIHENVNLFGHRARRERPDLSARPLAIAFDADEVAEDDQRRRFVQAMGRLRRASVSVLHGNPYVHLSILDYYDGSTFDIWVLTGNEITIVPQMKATVSATKRLVNHVFDYYAEGHIRSL